jgi:antirestriction protein ArdC
MSKKFDIYETVTDTIVSALENGIAPWVKPWRNGGVHRNGDSGRAYNGINTLLLEIAGLGSGWSSREWYTYKGAAGRGGQVQKGAKGTMVVFWQIIKNKDDETFPLLRYYKVFNRAQIDGLPDEVKPDVVGGDFVPTDRAENFIESTGAKITYHGDRAYYSPSTDSIVVPKPEDFASAAAFYATTFHELVHWTGHSSRINRLGSVVRGSEEYAFEELIAELGAAFLCELNGVDGSLQHPEYIGAWLKKLKGDKKFIFSAASAARKAVEFMTKSEVEEGVEE